MLYTEEGERKSEFFLHSVMYREYVLRSAEAFCVDVLTIEYINDSLALIFLNKSACYCPNLLLLSQNAFL